MYERQLYDNLKDTLYLWCLHYLKEEKGINELPDDKLEKIEDLDETDFYKFSDLEDFVNNIITEE